MPPPPNRTLRLLVPVLLLIVGIGVAIAVFANTRRTPAPTTPAPAQNTPTSPTPPPPPAATPSATPAPTAATTGDTAAPAPAPPTLGYSVRLFDAHPYDPIGSLVPLEKGGQDQMRISFARFGAGIEALELANHFRTIARTEHETIQAHYPVPGADPLFGAVGFAADRVEINGASLNLALDPRAPGKTFWRQVAPGSFEAFVDDGDGNEVARITRRYALPPGSYDFVIDQRVENRTGQPMAVRWFQYGPVDVPLETIRYGGDVRRVRFGYMLPGEAAVLSPDTRFALLPHAKALGSPVATATQPRYWPPKQLWPTPDTLQRNLVMAWSAMTGRYFAVAAYAPVDPVAATTPQAKAFSLVERVDRLAIPTDDKTYDNGRGPAGWMVLRFTSAPFTVAPGQSADVSIAAYAGPMTERTIGATPRAAAVGLEEVLIYTFSGPCVGNCTFQFLTLALRHFLMFLHDRLLHDWALAIVVLVLCVRSALHPVTKWSQIRMMRFGKRMQSLGPKQKAIAEKYKDDPAKKNAEMARLMREEGISPTGALGCLPMLLQTPVWIALFAMLFFTFELRHEAAFFGVFQRLSTALSGRTWAFLADLAEPDHFIPLGVSFRIPFLSGLMGPIEAVNILPLVLGVVFYIQQKYMQPPTTGTLTPEQEQQQKIMKVMMVVMFPLFMYNAPSGLALYFLVNSTLGILESRYIRRHVDKTELEPPKPRSGSASGKPSFFERLQTELEARQKAGTEARRYQRKRDRQK